MLAGIVPGVGVEWNVSKDRAMMGRVLSAAADKGCQVAVRR